MMPLHLPSPLSFPTTRSRFLHNTTAAATKLVFAPPSAPAEERDAFSFALFGKQNAIVLGGLIHKFNTLTRMTPGGGKFVQLAVNSVIHTPEVTAKNQLSGTGIGEYTGDQIRVEPAHSPAIEQERRTIERERAEPPRCRLCDIPPRARFSETGIEARARAGRQVTASA